MYALEILAFSVKCLKTVKLSFTKHFLESLLAIKVSKTFHHMLACFALKVS